jgi:hypothetical protein
MIFLVTVKTRFCSHTSQPKSYVVCVPHDQALMLNSGVLSLVTAHLLVISLIVFAFDLHTFILLSLEVRGDHY